MGTLTIRNLSKSFQSREVLKGVNIEVQVGEFVSILGPSGSGKSTLFHLIGGLLEPDGGEILLDGDVITGKRGLISYMPQQPALFPWRTVLENVLLGQEIAGKSDKRAALEMIGRAGLSGYENERPDALSGGMKQRAAFIRALLSPQPLILLDEPFSALDDFTRQEMHEWLLDIWAEHRKTILFVTHNVDEALFLSDRIVVLSSHPASVRAEWAIPFPRPREESLLLSDEFLEWKRKVQGEGLHA